MQADRRWLVYEYVLFGGTLDARITEYGTSVLAPGSSTPLDKVYKERLARFSGHLQSHFHVSMPTIRSEIHVLNGTQLDWLTGIRFGCCHVSVAIRNDVRIHLAKKVHFSSV